MRGLRLAGTALVAIGASSCELFGPSNDRLVGCASGFEEIEQTASATLADYRVEDAALLVRKDGSTVCRLCFAEPLGMDRTTYGDDPNPALSEGEVVSTLDDCGRRAMSCPTDSARGLTPSIPRGTVWC